MELQEEAYRPAGAMLFQRARARPGKPHPGVPIRHKRGDIAVYRGCDAFGVLGVDHREDAVRMRMLDVAVREDGVHQGLDRWLPARRVHARSE